MGFGATTELGCCSHDCPEPLVAMLEAEGDGAVRVFLVGHSGALGGLPTGLDGPVGGWPCEDVIAAGLSTSLPLASTAYISNQRHIRCLPSNTKDNATLIPIRTCPTIQFQVFMAAYRRRLHHKATTLTIIAVTRDTAAVAPLSSEQVMCEMQPVETQDLSL